MYIKDICLEGFKSYATRTVVPGFDPYFNAITGLNGSCKFNILDSICLELVHKQGQAGIAKAIMSVVFDNSDRSRSPLGYQDCPEITVIRQVCGKFDFSVYVVFVSATEKYPKQRTKIADIEDNHKRIQVEIKEMEAQVSNLTAEKEASMGGEVKVLSENVDALSRELVKQASVLKNQEDTLRSEKRMLKREASVVKRAEDGAADLKQRVEGLSKNLEECEKRKCLEDQLADAKVAFGRAETELKQLNTKISHREKELKEKTNELISKREEAVSVENELIVRRKDVENIKMALESLTYKEGQMEALQKVGKENTELALSLVGYDEELKHLMSYSEVSSTVILKQCHQQ
ncbi:hypothetical protein AAG906_018447 [Vitis piasezkii]